MKLNKKIYSLKGMVDYLPDKLYIWDFLLNKIKNILKSYNFNHINFPILENKSLFYKTLSNNNFINKETYSFLDKKSREIILRPEGTSCCVRFGIENGLLRGKKYKWWYFGPMFRYEKPQLCRYREFYQLGLETFGYDSNYIELELILIINKFLNNIYLDKFVKLEINYIGSNEIINKYIKYLIYFFNKNKNLINKNYHKYINTNPIKILEIFEKDSNFNKFNLYKIYNFFNKKDIKKFNNIIKLLDYFNILYIINPFLIRGLNYYNGIIFEWKTNMLSSKLLSICGGGRYNNLIKELGGNYTPAIGLAIGWNRLVELFVKTNELTCLKLNKNNISILISCVNMNLAKETIKFSEEVRNIFSNLIFNTYIYMSSLEKKINFSIKNNFLYLILLTNVNNKISYIFKNFIKNNSINLSKNNLLNLIKNINDKNII